MEITDSGAVLRDQYAAALSEMASGNHQESERLLLELLSDNPKEPDVLRQIAVCKVQQGQQESALPFARLACQLEPSHAGGHAMFGSLAGLFGDHKTFREHTEIALALAPDMPAAKWNLSLCQLAYGEWKEGWKNYEWGKPHGTRPRRTVYDDWNGIDDLNGRKLWVHGEQGQGDCIQFARYVKVVKDRYPNCEIWLEVYDDLLWVLGSVADEVFAMKQDGSVPLGWNPSKDKQIPLLSLPFALECDIPATVKIDPNQDIANAFRASRPSGKCYGIVWQGSKGNVNDRNRSMPLADVEKLISACPGVQFISFQKDCEQLPKGLAGQAGLTTWGHTAAALSTLDGLVSVDTGIVHVAGSAGVPVHLMLSLAQDWRWTYGRDDSVWYPNFHLHRSQEAKDWSGVIESVAEALNA